MDFHVYVHFVNEPERATQEKLDRILAHIRQLGVSMASVSEQVKQLAADFDTETNAVAARIDAILAKLAEGTVDPADVAALQAVSDRLKILGQDSSNPIPTV